MRVQQAIIDLKITLGALFGGGRIVVGPGFYQHADGVLIDEESTSVFSFATDITDEIAVVFAATGTICQQLQQETVLVTIERVPGALHFIGPDGDGAAALPLPFDPEPRPSLPATTAAWEAFLESQFDLSPRERAVCARRALGATEGAIARELYLSVGTVKIYDRSLRQKFGLSSIRDLPHFCAARFWAHVNRGGSTHHRIDVIGRSGSFHRFDDVANQDPDEKLSA